MDNDKSLVPAEMIAGLILLIRGKKVMLDHDLAKMYGVSTKALNQAVKRNAERFPADFIFQLTKEEKVEVVTNCDHLANLRFSSSLPFAFTEHGTIMAASLLDSAKAVEISVFVVRAFIQLRESLLMNERLAGKIAQLERRIAVHDKSIDNIVAVINQLMAPPEPMKKPVGFHWAEDVDPSVKKTPARKQPPSRKKSVKKLQ